MTLDQQVPPSLLSVQKWFGSIVTKPLRDLGDFRIPVYDTSTSQEIQTIISKGPKLSSQQRIGIYNQQYWWRLFGLMQDRYPAILRLFGISDFNFLLVEPYFLKYPPNHWSLRRLGEQFSLWISENYHDEDKELILHLAELEEGYERVHVAPCLELLSAGELEHPFYLQPFVALLCLPCDLFSFRDLLLAQPLTYWETEDFPALKWFESPHYFVLHRKNKNVVHEEISKTEFDLLKCFQTGSSLSQAISRTSISEDADVFKWFEKWGSMGWFSSQSY